MTLLGQKIGRYQLTEMCGKGGTSSVYKANREDDPSSTFAIKIYGPVDDLDEATLRVIRESGIGALIKHSCLAETLECGEDDKIGRYLVMRYVAGQPLDEVLITRGTMLLQEVVIVLGQIAAALDYLHSLQIMHRDVKPSNIILSGLHEFHVSSTSRSTLVDFGSAKRMSQSEDDVTVPAQMPPMTVKYASSELCRTGEAGPEGDVYSLGVIAIEMLTGRAPFDEGKNFIASLTIRQTAKPKSIRELAPEIDFPPGLQKILDRSMADRLERYATAGEFLHELKEIARVVDQSMRAPR